MGNSTSGLSSSKGKSGFPLYLAQEDPLGEEFEEELRRFRSGEKYISKKDIFDVDFSDIEIKSSISENHTVIIIKGIYNSRSVALKLFRNDVVVGGANADEFEKEVEVVLSIPSHPNIIEVMKVVVHPPRVGIVMEYADFGDMDSFLRINPKFPFKLKLRMLADVARGLKHLHKQKFIHKRLCLSKVLLMKSLEAKLSSVGFEELINKVGSTKTKSIASDVYSAPELRSGHYDQKVDIFSFSMLLYTSITGIFEPYGTNVKNLYYRVQNNPNLRPDLTILPKNHRIQITEMITRSWNHEPEKRQSSSSLEMELMSIYDDLPIKNYNFVHVASPNKSSNKYLDDFVEKLDIKFNSNDEIKQKKEEVKQEKEEIKSVQQTDDTHQKSLKLRIRTTEQDDSETEEAELFEFTRESLLELCCIHIVCEEFQIVKICKSHPTGLRKISRDSTVELLEEGDIIVVQVDLTRKNEKEDKKE